MPNVQGVNLISVNAGKQGIPFHVKHMSGDSLAVKTPMIHAAMYRN